MESSFFLIALHRYPHALSTCASAFEMAIEASAVGLGKKDGLRNRIEKARYNSQEIACFPEARVRDFCKIRNRITHEGFNSKDNSESVGLYLEIGFPLLRASYHDFHSYDLTDGLLQEYVELLNVADEVYRRANTLTGCDLSYCLNPFGQLIRWSFKDNFSTNWEIEALVHADETGLKFDHTYKEKEKLEHMFGASWVFDCPICNEPDLVVCELDESELGASQLVPKRLACIVCGLVVRESHPFLSEVLMRTQIANAKEQILKGYGLT